MAVPTLDSPVITLRPIDSSHSQRPPFLFLIPMPLVLMNSLAGLFVDGLLLDGSSFEGFSFAGLSFVD